MKLLRLLVLMTIAGMTAHAGPGDAYAVSTMSPPDGGSTGASTPTKAAADGYENVDAINAQKSSVPSEPTSPEARKFQADAEEKQREADRAQEAATLAQQADEDRAQAAALEKRAEANEERAQAAAQASEGAVKKEQQAVSTAEEAAAQEKAAAENAESSVEGAAAAAGDQPPHLPPRKGAKPNIAGDQPPPVPPRKGAKPGESGAPAAKPADGGYAEFDEDGNLKRSEADHKKDLEWAEIQSGNGRRSIAGHQALSYRCQR